MAIEQTPQLERCLQEGADRSASDIYLIPGEPVSFRIRGIIERCDGDSLASAEVYTIAVAAVGPERLQEVGSVTGQVTTSCGLPGVVGGLLSVARAYGEYTVVIRLLPLKIPDLTVTGVPEAMLRAAEAPNGLIVFSGPAGSGKTTSLLSVIEYINANKPCHICTVEDPITIRLTAKKAIIQQREVGTDVPSLVAGIAAAMRQDLDVLVVGEMKTVEEVEACITASQTGHLVLTQVHAYSPQDAIQRLIDVVPGEDSRVFRRHLAEALRGVSVQYLLPKGSGEGRLGAYGVLIPDKEMREAITEGRDILDRTSPLPEGCQGLAEDIARLQREGRITEGSAREALSWVERH